MLPSTSALFSNNSSYDHFKEREAYDERLPSPKP
jgi:hypothetical protein